MDERDLAVIHRWAEAFQRGEVPEDLWDPNLVIVNAEGWAIETTYHGHEGLRRWWEELSEAFSDFRLEVEEIEPVDEHRVLTTQRFHGHFRTTGIPFDGPWASVLTVRDGRIAEAIGYLSKGRALKAIEEERTSR